MTQQTLAGFEKHGKVDTPRPISGADGATAVLGAVADADRADLSERGWQRGRASAGAVGTNAAIEISKLTNSCQPGPRKPLRAQFNNGFPHRDFPVLLCCKT